MTRADAARRVGTTQGTVAIWCCQEGIDPVYGTGGGNDSAGNVILDWLRGTHDPYIRRTWRDTLRQGAGLPPEAWREDEDPSPGCSALANLVPLADVDPVGDTTCLKCGRRSARTDQPCETRDGQGRLLYVTTTTTCLRRQCGKTIPVALVGADPLDLPEEEAMPVRRPLPPIAEILETVHDDTAQGLPLVDRHTFFAPPRTEEEEPKPMSATRDKQHYVDLVVEGKMTQSQAAAELGLANGRTLAGAVHAERRRRAQIPEQPAVLVAPQPAPEGIDLGFVECEKCGHPQGLWNGDGLCCRCYSERENREIEAEARAAQPKQEQPPTTIRLLTSPDVRAFIQQPEDVQVALRTCLEQPEDVQAAIHTLLASLKG